MGRPLNKRYFGDPADAGTQLQVQFWDGAAPKAGHIVKQLGSRRYRVTDGTLVDDGILFNGAPTQAGEIQLIHASGNVMKLTGRKALLGDGTQVAWTVGDFPGASAVNVVTKPADEPKAKTKEEPKAESMIDKIAETVKETVKNVVSEPESKSYKPRAKKAPARKTTRAKTSPNKNSNK